MVSYEERDLFMSQENQRDLYERLTLGLTLGAVECNPTNHRMLPQIFVDGKLLGVC